MAMRTVFVVTALTLAGIVALGGSNEPSAYGFGVEVTPDVEFDDFVQCGLVVYELESEKPLPDLPALRIMAGGVNTMSFSDQDGLEVDFTCTVDSQLKEVSYELAGTVHGSPVLNHIATVRFQ